MMDIFMYMWLAFKFGLVVCLIAVSFLAGVLLVACVGTFFLKIIPDNWNPVKSDTKQ